MSSFTFEYPEETEVKAGYVQTMRGLLVGLSLGATRLSGRAITLTNGSHRPGIHQLLTNHFGPAPTACCAKATRDGEDPTRLAVGMAAAIASDSNAVSTAKAEEAEDADEVWYADYDGSSRKRSRGTKRAVSGILAPGLLGARLGTIFDQAATEVVNAIWRQKRIGGGGGGGRPSSRDGARGNIVYTQKLTAALREHSLTPLQDHVCIASPNRMYVTEIDLLCIDKKGCLVTVELKRGFGTHFDLPHRPGALSHLDRAVVQATVSSIWHAKQLEVITGNIPPTRALVVYMPTDERKPCQVFECDETNAARAAVVALFADRKT